MATERTTTPFVERIATENMEKLRANTYPGRGFVMGVHETGEKAVQIYWVMGRSENSRNRILETDGKVVKTKAFDESKMEDPSLIIYNAMREVSGIHVVGNGDQTDTIARAVEKRESFKNALDTRSYEPDSPNFTPRISGVFSRGFMFTFSIIRKESTTSDNALHEMQYGMVKYTPNRKGLCLHTYEGDGDPLPAFKGRPYTVALDGSIDDIANTYWEILNAENKVALAAKTIDLETGEVDLRIINKLGS